MARVQHGTTGSEKALRRYVAEELRARGCLVYAIETDTVVGVPDLLAVLPGGRFLGIETKKKGGELSKVQKKNLTEIERRGGAAAMVASRSEARSLFRSLELPRLSAARPARLRQANTPPRSSSEPE